LGILVVPITAAELDRRLLPGLVGPGKIIGAPVSKFGEYDFRTIVSAI